MSNWPFAPIKRSIKVYADLPLGAVEVGMSYVNHREARGWVDGEYKNYYYCPMCKGWIEGYPNRHRVNTLEPLSGRSGHAENCQRCGYELSFMGIVS